MNSHDNPKDSASSRRSFLKTSAVLGAAAVLPSFSMRAAANKNSNLRILHIGVGGIGGIGSLAPDRRKDLASLGLRAMAGGILVSYINACIAGIFI